MSCLEKVLKGLAPRDVFTARGHVNITAKNRYTAEITKDPYVTPRGDCIVACCAEKAAGELSEEVLKALAGRGVAVLIIEAGDLAEDIIGETPRAVPTSRWRLVARKSAYVDDSTVMIRANKAAAQLDRRLIRLLKEGVPIRVTIGVCPEDT